MEKELQTPARKSLKTSLHQRVSTAATTFRETRSSNGFNRNGSAVSTRVPLTLDFMRQKFLVLSPTNKVSKKLFLEIRDSIKRNEKAEWMKFSNENSKECFSQAFQFNEEQFLHQYSVLEDVSKSDHMSILTKLLKTKNFFAENLKQRNLEKTIDCKRLIKNLKILNQKGLISIIHLALTREDLPLLAQTIRNIAETYFIFGETKNAMFTSVQLRWFCELTGLHKYKIPAFINLAKCCKNIGKMSESLILFKKALQYCWFFGESDLELDLYEEIGLIHCNLGNLEKAKLYHERCLSNELEPNTSISKTMAIKNIENLLNECSPPIKTVDAFFFERFPSLPFDLIASKAGNTNLILVANSNRFSSSQPEEFTITNILHSPDFNFEIMSPLHCKKQKNLGFVSQTKSTNDIIEKKEEIKKKPSFKISRHKRSDTEMNANSNSAYFTPSLINELFESKHRKSEVQPKIFRVSSAMKKMSLGEKIKHRLELGKYLDENRVINDLQTIQRLKKNVGNIRPKTLMNHLSPRRNFVQYPFACNFLYSQPNTFFDKIITEQYYK